MAITETALYSSAWSAVSILRSHVLSERATHKEKTRRDLRQKRKGINVPLEKVDFFLSSQNTDAELIQHEEETRMRNILQHMPENQRIAFTMLTMEDFSYVEIAQAMNLSLSAVESLLFRSRVNLKKIIKL